MKIARLCTILLLLIPAFSVLAQMGERTRPNADQIAQAQAQMNREHKWVNPLPDTKHPQVTHHTYQSKIMDVEVGYGLYLPPGYDDSDNSTKRYPVVYFLHGGGGNEARMLDPARVDIAGPIHNRIKTGVVSPMIYVFPNGGKVPHYDYEESMAESTLMTELIPLIDAQYRTIPNRSIIEQGVIDT